MMNPQLFNLLVSELRSNRAEAPRLERMLDRATRRPVPAARAPEPRAR